MTLLRLAGADIEYYTYRDVRAHVRVCAYIHGVLVFTPQRAEIRMATAAPLAFLRGTRWRKIIGASRRDRALRDFI